MFAYPWHAAENSQSENAVDPVFIKISELNQQLIAHTEKLLTTEVFHVA